MLNNLTLRTKLKVLLLATPAVAATALLAGVIVALSGADTAEDMAGLIQIIGIIGLVLVVASTVVGMMLAKGVARQIQAVAMAAEELANDRIPQLVEATDDDDTATFGDFDGAANDDLGRVVGALNTVQRTTSSLAGKQHEEIRKGLQGLVVNLVRRNQSLLDRQIEDIDQLEAGEEDPDRLEKLFGVDHLATRMRRNAESLLVLAGSEPPRRKGGPISINDLMRVAMGEIEGYQSVHLTQVDDGEVSAQAAFDIAHLLSELLENATQFSPPNAQVEMAGSCQQDGSYLISVTDHGIGMNAELVEQTNQLLLNPPELTLDLGRKLGFLVVARLANRLGVTVELAQTPGGAGVTALVLLPGRLVGADGVLPQTGSDEQARPVDEAMSAPVEAAPETSPAVAKPDSWSVDPVEPAAPAALSIPGLDEEPGWTPPTLPERGADLGKREGSDDPSGAPAQSEALARLLGQAPPPAASPTAASPAVDAPSAPAPPEPTAIEPPPAEPAPVEPAPIEAPPADLPTREVGASGAGAATEPVPQAPPQLPEVEIAGATDAPQHLEEAVPSGDNFDAGVASLLAGQAPDVPLPERTSKGLVKRDRSQSQAPAHEGRVIPDGGRSVTASSRDPEEIRNMLARYRKAREGKNPAAADPGASTEAPKTDRESSTESGGQA